MEHTEDYPGMFLSCRKNDTQVSLLCSETVCLHRQDRVLPMLGYNEQIVCCPATRNHLEW